MTRNLWIGVASLTAAALVVGHLHAQRPQQHAATGATQAQGGLIIDPITTGPDVICGQISSASSWGLNGAGTILAYTFGVTECNIGDAPFSEDFNTAHHPIIAQNIFRMHNGRFEQLGQKWPMHEFCALQNALCGSCTPFCGGCCPAVGVGCSSSTTSSRQGQVAIMGPKQHVNAATGIFPIPHTTPVNAPGDTSTVTGRIQVHKTDVEAAGFPGARFFGETQFVAADDAAAGNDDNNASWREVAVNPVTYVLTMLSTGADAISGTNRQEIAMFAWQEFDTNAGPAPNAPVTIVTADVLNDGRFYLGSKVTNNGNGTWTYEYALHNFNSDRSGQAFSVPLGASPAVSGIGFHDVDYHSADGVNAPIYDQTDWSASASGGAVTWSTQTFAQNENANALRWGTLYNFRFTANAPPVPADVTLTLFKPGDPQSITIPTFGPGNGTFHPADLNQDGAVDGLDVGILLSQWGNCPIDDLAGCSADLNDDGWIDGLDVGILLAAWTT